MINDVPTVFEVVTGAVKQVKDQAASQNNSSKSKSSGRIVRVVSHFCLQLEHVGLTNLKN